MAARERSPVGRLDPHDLAHVLDRTSHVWSGDLRGARVLVTGAAGFVGSWMLETMLHANEALGLGLRATALVRNQETFVKRFPHLASSPSVRLVTGDVRVAHPEVRGFSHYVHCASAASPEVNSKHPEAVIDLIERGTAAMVDAATTGTRFLQMSSGAVYGSQPLSIRLIDESCSAAAEAREPVQGFGAAKRRAEQYGEAAVARGVGFVSARVFALVGPRLPLEGEFAVGNFLGDAVAGRSVRVTGDGTPVRSWLHAADLAAWCWTLLARGTAGAAYNVGSEEEMPIAEAARRVAALTEPPLAVSRGREPEPGATPSRYVPSTRRAREELALDAWITFDDALRRTWNSLLSERHGNG